MRRLPLHRRATVRVIVSRPVRRMIVAMRVVMIVGMAVVIMAVMVVMMSHRSPQ
jgi:cell division protein FtsL